MKRKYGKNDILKFIYGEMEPVEHDEFLDALCTDENLFETFEQIQEGQKELKPVDLAPSTQSIQRIQHIANSAARRKRVRSNQFVIGKNTVLNHHHLLSVCMVFFTCLTIGLVMYMYKGDDKQENSWSMSPDAMKFENRSLDSRLDFARDHLHNILDNRPSAPMRVHHDTYQLVNTDPATEEQSVVLLNIK